MLVLLAPGARAADPPIHREGTEWCDAWMPNLKKQDLPRIMLIGDSITRAYFTGVEEHLKGKAYIARIATSKAVGDSALLAEIATFLTQMRFEVVHFNIGMHGWAYTEDEYKQYFPALVETIKKSAPGAKLIWASTTPVRKDRDTGPSNDRIQTRNSIARQYAAAKGIPIDDLHGLMTPHADLHSDDIHFNKEGNAMLAVQVAREIEKLLPAPRAN